MVFFESPHRIADAMDDFAEIIGDRPSHEPSAVN